MILFLVGLAYDEILLVKRQAGGRPVDCLKSRSVRSPKPPYRKADNRLFMHLMQSSGNTSDTTPKTR